jgi:hypothetical protein
MAQLDAARSLASIPFHITSSNRPYTYKDPTNHLLGYAVDIRALTSQERYTILSSLIRTGFNRLGVYDRHIHADIDPKSPPHVLWVGTSS